MLGLGRTEYLRRFVRANLLDAYPGPVFPLQKARPLAAGLAQRLAPLPLVLLGRGVQQAFSFPVSDLCVWVDYELDGVWVRAAAIPHPSGLNHFYNTAEHREWIGSWLREESAPQK